MSTTVSLNGVNFSIPRTGDDSWSNTGGVDDYLVALSTGILQKSGGAFTLLADVDFGSGFGLRSLYFTSRGSTVSTSTVTTSGSPTVTVTSATGIAIGQTVSGTGIPANTVVTAISGTTVTMSANATASATVTGTFVANVSASGLFRLATADTVSWRNAGNTADLPLTVNASNTLTFNGTPLLALALGAANTSLVTNSGGTAYQWALLTNANLDPAAAVAYSKLALTGSIVNADISSSAAIAYSKLALAGAVKLASDVTGILPTANGGTGVNGSATFPSSGVVVTEAGAETLTNKTLTAPVIASIVNTGTLTLPTATDTLVGRATTDTLTNKTLTNPVQSGYEDFTEIATPATPGAGVLRVYSKSGDNLFIKNSAGTETQLGSGSGEKNYAQSGSSTATGWTASGAGITVANDTTAAELPRPQTTQTGIKVTGVSGSTAYAYYRFILDDADANKKLKVQFDLKPVSGYASNDFQVSVYSNTASDYTTGNTRLSLSTDSSAVTGIPNLTGTFRTTFDAPATSAKWIEVRIGLNGANTHACVFSDVVVGPGVVTQGAAVSAPQAFTPTVANVGGLGSTAISWSRTGSNMTVQGYWTNGATAGGAASLTLPLSLTTDAGVLTGGTNQVVGWWASNSSSATTPKRGTILAAGNSATVTFSIDDYTNGTAATTSQNASAIWATGTVIDVNFTVPVAQWAGSGTVNVAQNDVEYAASTTGTWDANALVANTVYGPGGAAMSGALTTSRTKAVQFVTPIQATDKIYLEYRNAATGIWTDQATSEFPYTQTAPIAFGAGIIHNGTTSNSVTVLFNQYAQAGTAFGSATGASNWNSSFYDFWRLRKVSGGQAIGFGIVNGSSAGLVPASNTSLDNASATRLGLMQYSHGGSYNGGLAPTITLSAGGGTLSSVIRSTFIPYQMNDGTWRMRFNLYVSLSSVARTDMQLAVNGVTSKNVAGYLQLVAGSDLNAITACQSFWNANSSIVEVQHASSTTTAYSISGDVELDSKPTWAY